VSVWYAVRITVSSNAAEAMEFCLNELGALGTEIDRLRKKPTDDVTVVGYFNELPEANLLDSQLYTSLSIYQLDRSAVRSVTTDVVEETDWLAEWKKHWRPTRVGRFFVAPPWEQVDDADEGTIVIRIEPNMAFGTGTHETTKLCLKAIDELYRPEMSFLDIGTGTGILSIAAAKMQTAKTTGIVSPAILAVELDPDSVTIARENAAANGVADEIEVREGTLEADLPAFDFVCANLTIDIIRPLLPLLVARFKKVLVLSGILVEQEQIITSELASLGVGQYTIARDGEWISVTVGY